MSKDLRAVNADATQGTPPTVEYSEQLLFPDEVWAVWHARMGVFGMAEREIRSRAPAAPPPGWPTAHSGE